MRHLFTLIAILCPLTLAAQSSDFFKKSPKISNGTLPNGVSYYIVKNDSDKSFADFALVQKGNESRELAHRSLGKLPHFGEVKPYEYLAKKGIGYTVSGLASYSHSGSVYRFQNVPMYDEAASDSLLLMVFDLMGTYPNEQAVVISGDVDTPKLLERMKLFSMLVTPRSGIDNSDVFKWEPTDSIEFQCAHFKSDRTAFVEATFCTSRMAPADMASTQSWVAGMFADELGQIVRKRLENEFRKRGIPQGGISFSYKGSKNPLKQERYRIQVCVDRENLTQATEILGAVTASFGVSGISAEEFSLSKNGFLSRAAKPLLPSRSDNPSYVNKCISDYLFGTGLFEDESQREFYSVNRLEKSMERRLLTNFASAVFQRNRNLILHYSSPENLFSRDSLVNCFHKGWDKAVEEKARIVVKIDSSAINIQSGKLKLKTTVPDPSIGGEIWNFDNGVKVLFKKSPAKGTFSYGFMFRGGASAIPGLRSGELSYIGDMLGLYDVAGMSAADFRSLMESKGIRLEPEITPTDLRFTGTAPVSSLTMLFKGMHALAYSRNYNSGNFEYYCRCQKLRSEKDRRSGYGIQALFDSLASPQYALSPYRRLGSLDNETPLKAQRFYDESFGSWSNGLIILVGDFDDYALKQYLSSVLGSFKTRAVASRRNIVERHLAMGRTSLAGSSENPEVGDGTVSVNISFTNAVPFSLQRYAALKIGARALRNELISELANHGMYVSVRESYELRPSELMSLCLQCRKCTGAGLPDGVGPADADYAFISVRKALEKLAAEPVPSKALKAYKASLSAQMKVRESRGETMVDAALARYSMGKNIASGYDSAINAVTAQEIMSLMKTLQEGTTVEYTVK